MKHLIVLLLTFAHGGHWLGGRTESLSIAWPAESGMPAATLHWECTVGPVALASGNAEMPDAAHPLTVSLSVPHVRITTRVHFSCIARDKVSDKQLAGGESNIVIYPDDLIGTFEKQYAGKRFSVLTRSESLKRLIDLARIRADSITNLSQLGLNQPDVLIVGPDELTSRPLQRPAILPMADQGCQVILLRQSNVDSVAGYRLTRREDVSNLNGKSDHPLLANLDSDTLQAWITHDPAMAVRLPAGDASLPIGFWHPEAASRSGLPVDALLVTKTVGTGRIVLCQLPADDWADDPRSQILLHNLLAYATTRPEPTPPPGRRCASAAAPVNSERNILAPVGE